MPTSENNQLNQRPDYSTGLSSVDWGQRVLCLDRRQSEELIRNYIR